jgi:hypothetical protein
MVPPIWLDESGERRPMGGCVRCGREAPIHRFRLEDLRRLGWRLFALAEFMNWCGHAQALVPISGASQ